MKKICIFGDSIVFGHNDPEGGGWADRLKRDLWQRKAASVVNLGISGNTTEDLLKRFKKESISRNPNLLIFAIGINDSRYIESEDSLEVKPSKFQKNLQELIVQAKKFTNKIIFIGLTKVDETKTMPIPWSPDKYYTNINIDKYRDILKEESRANNLHYIPLKDLISKADMTDGLHPDSDGHHKIFERVQDYLIENKFIN